MDTARGGQRDRVMDRVCSRDKGKYVRIYVYKRVERSREIKKRIKKSTNGTQPYCHITTSYYTASLIHNYRNSRNLHV